MNGHNIFAHFLDDFRILTTCVLITRSKMVDYEKRDQIERSNETQNATELREVMERSKMVNAQHLFALY